MGKLNMKDWINQTILNKKVISIPIMTHPGIEFIGKTVHDAVTNGQVHYEAIKALCDKYPSAAATVIMDLTVEAEAFGAEIVFPENEVPSVSGRLLADETAIEALEIPALNKGRIAQYLKANMLTAKNITDRPVLAGCIGPYSLAGRLYDMSEIMMLIYQPRGSQHFAAQMYRFHYSVLHGSESDRSEWSGNGGTCCRIIIQ